MKKPAVKGAALLVAALALAACDEDAQRHAKRVFHQEVTRDGKLVKGVYHGMADKALDDATRERLRARVASQRY